MRLLLAIPAALVACSQPGAPSVTEPVTTSSARPAYAAPIPTPTAVEPAPFEAESDTDDGFVAVAAEPTPPAVEVEPEPSATGYGIQVQAGESLVRLADFANLSAEDISAASGLAVTATLYPGDELLLPLDEEAAAGFELRRAEFHDARVESWLGRHGGLVDVEAHSVATGETAWGVAQAEGGLPMWVLAWFNDGSDLDGLRIGDELMVPIVGDRLAAAPASEPASVATAEPSGPEIGEPVAASPAAD